ncbi:MAG TPA: efflux RND transporter periplasmic adaptor subunit [Methylophilaceae bacterium]
MLNKNLPPKIYLPLIALAIGLYLTQPGFLQTATAADDAQHAITVTSITAQATSMQKQLAFSGPVVAREEVMVFANIPQGRIQQVMVEENQKVSAGELLATVDTTLLQNQKTQQQAMRQKAVAAVAQQEAGLEEAQVQLEQAQSDKKSAPLPEPTAEQRTSAVHMGEIHVKAAQSGLAMAQAEVEQAKASLLETGLNQIEKLQLQAVKQRADATVTQQQANLEEAQAELALAQSEKNSIAPDPRPTAQRLAEIHVRAAQQAVSMAQADLALADAQIAETDLHIKEAAVYAPVAGTIITRKAYHGLVLGQGTDPLFVMLRDDVLEIELEVSSADAAKLKLGMPVAIQILGDAALYPGKVRRTAGQIDRLSQVAKVRVSFDKRPALIPGQFARVTASLPAKKGIYLPDTAIRFEGASASVFTVTDGKAVRIPIKIGERANGMVEVLQGVTPGMQIVSGAVAFLHPGDAIHLVPSNTQGKQ